MKIIFLSNIYNIEDTPIYLGGKKNMHSFCSVQNLEGKIKT